MTQHPENGEALFKPPLNQRFQELLHDALGQGNHRGSEVKPLEGMENTTGIILACYLACDSAGEKFVNHVLLEGTIGTAKTQLAKNIGAALLGKNLYSERIDFGKGVCTRISGNPDTRPQDIVGMDLLGDQQKLQWCDGPIFDGHLLFYVDELNRMPSRTQSVLLEAMAEHQVTVNTLDPQVRKGRRRMLENFFMLVSQNPLTDIGTEPLPEAQLDRFLVKLATPIPSNLSKIISQAHDNSTSKASSENAHPEAAPNSDVHADASPHPGAAIQNDADWRMQIKSRYFYCPKPRSGA